MTFQDLKDRFEKSFVTQEEYELIKNADCVSGVEFYREYLKYYDIDEYYALDENEEDSFDFYF